MFREAATWNYTINASVGEETVEISKGSAFEQDIVEYNYPRYINIGTALYSIPNNGSAGWYKSSFTLSQADQAVAVNGYTLEESVNVAFLREAEDIETLTEANEPNAGIRMSMGRIARNAGTEPAVVATLPAGKYTLTSSVWGGKGTTFVFKAGDKAVLEITTSGSSVTNTGEEFILTEETDITLDPTESGSRGIDFVLVNRTGDAAVNVSIAYSDGLATYTPAYDLNFTYAKNIAAYTATVSGDKVNLTRVNTVAAGEGVLIRSLNGDATEEEIPVAAETVEKSADNMFVGTLTDIDALATEGDGVVNYILNYGDLGTGFYRANKQKVDAGKAYLSVPAESAAKISFFSLDGTVTAIEGVEAEAAEGDKVFYNLSGQRVENPAKGLYIVNGKKVIIK